MAMRQFENDQAEDIGSGVHAHLIFLNCTKKKPN